MYISYANLWKQLIDKKISKTDLMTMTGISSRTLAKLSKNESVTTDTLVRICEALDCSVTDIMEICSGNEVKSFYDVFKSKAVLIRESEHYRTYTMEFKDEKYLITKSKKPSTKFTSIYLKDNSVVWRQNMFLIGGHTSSWEHTIRRSDFCEKGYRSIFLISGGPFNVMGLDDNHYISSKSTPKSVKDVYVMTIAAFKLFAPIEESKGD